MAVEDVLGVPTSYAFFVLMHYLLTDYGMGQRLTLKKKQSGQPFSAHDQRPQDWRKSAPGAGVSLPIHAQTARVRRMKNQLDGALIIFQFVISLFF